MFLPADPVPDDPVPPPGRSDFDSRITIRGFRPRIRIIIRLCELLGVYFVGFYCVPEMRKTPALTGVLGFIFTCCFFAWLLGEDSNGTPRYFLRLIPSEGRTEIVYGLLYGFS